MLSKMGFIWRETTLSSQMTLWDAFLVILLRGKKQDNLYAIIYAWSHVIYVISLATFWLIYGWEYQTLSILSTSRIFFTCLVISSFPSWFVLFMRLSLLKFVFFSLENAGESSVLSMLRSLRMLFGLVAKVTPSAVVSCSHVIDAQVDSITCYLVCISIIQFTVLPLME